MVLASVSHLHKILHHNFISVLPLAMVEHVDVFIAHVDSFHPPGVYREHGVRWGSACRCLTGRRLL